MKYIKIFLLIILIFSFLLAEITENDYTRPKIGLVLSGGGALGFAHIGILEVIDSLNIPIDYIAGTSMGGIAGGLYSLGYNGYDIEQLVHTIDWIDIFTDMPERKYQSYFQKKDDGKYQFIFGFSKGEISLPTGLIYGQKISLLLSNLSSKFEQIDNFDDLPIPFRCVAVDLITGNEVILKKGSISKALRATMSIPTIFNPVQWGDSLLIDGGLLNNLPVDVVRNMGADIVIAVNVSLSTKPTSNLNSALKILERSITIPASNRSIENIKNVDIYIEPDLTGYGSAEFSIRKINKIINIGKLSANNAIPELIQICQKYNIELDTTRHSKTKIIRNIYVGDNNNISTNYILDHLNINHGDTLNIRKLKINIASLKLNYKIKNIDYEFSEVNENELDLLLRVEENSMPTIYRISVEGNKTIPFSFIYHFLGISPSETLDVNLINERIDELYGLGYFETITYEIEPVDEDSIHLIFIIKEASQSLLRLGFTHDETYNFIGSVNLVSTKILIPGLRFEGIMRFAGLYDLSAKLYYPLRYNEISIYPFLQSYSQAIKLDMYRAVGDEIALYKKRLTNWSAGIGLLSNENFSTEVEYNDELLKVSPKISASDTSEYPEWKDRIKSIRGRLIYDNRDDVIFPRKGMLLDMKYEGSLEILNTDILYDKYEINIDYFKSIGVRHTFRLFAQLGIGNENLPPYKWFFYGGPNRLVGYALNEFAYFHTSIFGIEYRYKVIDNLYLKAIYNTVPNYNENYYPIDLNMLTGYGIGIKYNTILGPLELILSRGDKLNYINISEKKNVLYFRFGYYLH